MHTRLLEELDRAEDFPGIDILRTIRSVDPCMPWTVHMIVLAARQLEGSLSAHSAGEGQGATFTLDLPARLGEEHR